MAKTSVNGYTNESNMHVFFSDMLNSLRIAPSSVKCDINSLDVQPSKLEL